MSVAPLKSLDEFRTLVNSGQVVIIDYWATWCGPCNMISPVFETLASKPEFSSIKFVKVDVDEQEEISQEVGIRAMPTFQAFKDGLKIDELVGADPRQLTELIQRHV
ncbi:thioredoxin-like protein [Aspergillus caelatus]|uniref:Thioredoxin n=2 Tax=Aspergillus subgen. Circumdati TaxID=2720871 RepID=A0A5N7A1N7_9EURO|nr:thioredoxin-like protein [Aspergillus caelatus]KAE8363722.1 thioredoxin-like protein [Aspergillus caelatus]KAE8419301.1 thioredoxin-like protein [Aspergillus pseudocaelatus]